MLAEYEEDLKMALCQTDDEGQTVMAKLLKYYHRPSLKLVEYLLSHGILQTQSAFHLPAISTPCPCRCRKATILRAAKSSLWRCSRV
jgi:hypothetical protein